MGLATNEIRQCLSEQNQRLADWNSNQLLLLLDNVVARRKAARAEEFAEEGGSEAENDEALLGNAHMGVGDCGSILDETTDRIVMPEYDADLFIEAEITHANLDELVNQQLR